MEKIDLIRTDLIKALTSSTKMSPDECKSKFSEAARILDSTGIPHFMTASFMAVDDNGNPTDMGNMLKCEGHVYAIIECFLSAASQDDKYLDLFIDLGESLKKAREAGVIDILRKAKDDHKESLDKGVNI